MKRLVNCLLDDCTSQINYLRNNLGNNKYAHENKISHANSFQNKLYNFSDFLNETMCILANNPFLLLSGDAGVGKSHMLGDIVSKRIGAGYESLFLLGQHFVTDDNPWIQIFKQLQIDNIDSNNFLCQLDKIANESGKRLIIFIDAINEGKGRYFWPNHINSFVSEIQQYANLGLVLSVRSSYKNLFVPQGNTLNLKEYVSHGFLGVEYDASTFYFKEYNIESPSIPLLHPEFQNPLFLRLFCEGMKKSGLIRIPDGLQGIMSIIEFFIKGINRSLAHKLDYDSNINLVQKAINALIKYKIEHKSSYIPYEDASIVVNNEIKEFINHKYFIHDLISEGILSKNLFWSKGRKDEEGVYLVYERFGDHLTAQYLLEQIQDLREAFVDSGLLYTYIKYPYRYQGLLEAFSVIIPETWNKEFYECVPALEGTPAIIKAFIQSLLWRKAGTINANLFDYINKFIIKTEEMHDLFWETVLSVASNPRHYFNANFLHRNLMRFSMADRDAWWTQNLKYKYDNESIAKRLIDWARSDSDKSHISNESIKLFCIVLAWLHTSTNRKLRDYATKAMVSLLQNRINVLIEILELFKDINDPYVIERLYAVAYGCALRTQQADALPDLCIHIYKAIFDVDGEIYPHILLRDYARGVIEYAVYLGFDLQVDMVKIRPPYRSLLELKALTDDEIDNKYKNYGIILWSMATEYGRRLYGDFGRYVFESALKHFDVDTNLLSNIAIEWIFEKYGYDHKKHGQFDSEIRSGRGRPEPYNERIGKKYQWIAFYELLARVSDNCKMYDRWSYEKKEILYNGPWNPYVRDIDPSILVNKISEAWYSLEDIDKKHWCRPFNFDWKQCDSSNIDWLTNHNDLPDLKIFLSVKDEKGDEWLVLEGYPSWCEPDNLGEEHGNKKQLWFNIKSFLVKKENFSAIKSSNIIRQEYGDNSRYEVFSREYYWAPSYQDCCGEADNVVATTSSYLWEEEYDYSKEMTISYLKPCQSIFKGMSLKYSPREAKYVNNEGDVLCFAPNVSHSVESYCLIKKIEFLEYLKNNDLTIIWTIKGEKNITGDTDIRDEHDVDWLFIDGIYYINTNNKINGKVKFSNTLDE